jgi:hypothetical protein
MQELWKKKKKARTSVRTSSMRRLKESFLRGIET